MIVAIWSVTFRFILQWFQIQFISMEFPNSNFGPAVRSSALTKIFLALLGTLRQTPGYCLKSGHNHFPRHSLHHAVLTSDNTQYYLLSASFGVPHTNNEMCVSTTPESCATANMSKHHRTKKRMVEVTLHIFLICPRLAYVVTSTVCQL
jgi:hypothetical protein